jgi:hypothetical protein
MTATTVWGMLLAVGGAGAIGGVMNALLTDNGFPLPKEEAGIIRPGVLGNILLGAFAAVITWGLTGSLKDAVMLGTASKSTVDVSLTLTALVGAALAGAGGARVITGEVDKRFLRNAATDAAMMGSDPIIAKKMMTNTPAKAAEAARMAQDPEPPQPSAAIVTGPQAAPAPVPQTP